ncbi:MAG: PqiC family protein [Amphritea sp.]|nr:PqiC family protein [Amphritea sp.]
MRTNLSRLLTPLILIANMFTLNSCGTTPPSRFYMLEPMLSTEAIKASAGRKTDAHIGIGPVKFAGYLDTTRIVTRQEGTEIKLSETHRWAEPLNNNFARILAQNLSILMATDKVSLYPSRNWSEIDYQILVSVWQMDASKQGTVTLVANWGIRGKGDHELFTMKKSTFSTDVESTASYDDIVRALSKTVELLSREIAEAVESAQGH